MPSFLRVLLSQSMDDPGKQQFVHMVGGPLFHGVSVWGFSRESCELSFGIADWDLRPAYEQRRTCLVALCGNIRSRDPALCYTSIRLDSSLPVSFSLIKVSLLQSQRSDPT